MRLSNISILVVVLFLTSCFASKPSFNAPPAPGDAEALVFLYRANSDTNSLKDASFYINDTKVATLERHTHTWFYIKPDKYTLKQRWDSDGGPENSVSPSWKDKQVYFYELSPTNQRGKFIWSLRAVSQQKINRGLSGSGYMPAIKSDLIKTSVKPLS
jgi:hypothetical protein